MGTIGLSPVRSNRILVVLGSHGDEVFWDSAVNAANAVRGSIGVDIVEVLVTDPPVRLIAHHTETGSASGRVQNLEVIHDVLESRQGSFDAVAFSSVIEVPKSFHLEYFASRGEMVNPWGGVEAMFTHAISAMYDIPSAHSPMFESDNIANLRVGVVDPRMAAEAVSLTFLNCILKGLHRSPRLAKQVTSPLRAAAENVAAAARAFDDCSQRPPTARPPPLKRHPESPIPLRRTARPLHSRPVRHGRSRQASGPKGAPHGLWAGSFCTCA